MTIEQRLERLERALYEIAKTVGSKAAEQLLEPTEVAAQRKAYTLDNLI